MSNRQLKVKDIEKIQAMAKEKLIAYGKWNTVVGAQIFHILENESRVLYYPLEDQRVWGFSETIKGKAFACINTSLDFDKQVFAAAHELYHLWYGDSGEITISQDTEEPDCNQEVEIWANRFAAEFLVNEEVLLQEMKIYGINKHNISEKDALKLANIFVVPYRTMAKRLRELGLPYSNSYDRMMTYAEKITDMTGKRLGVTSQVRKEKISLSNLVDKAMELYEKKLITYEKLEYLLSLSELTPEEMRVEKQDSYKPPTEEELDAIMEE